MHSFDWKTLSENTDTKFEDIYIYIYLYIAETNTYIKTRFKGTGCRRTLSSAS